MGRAQIGWPKWARPKWAQAKMGRAKWAGPKWAGPNGPGQIRWLLGSSWAWPWPCVSYIIEGHEIYIGIWGPEYQGF